MVKRQAVPEPLRSELEEQKARLLARAKAIDSGSVADGRDTHHGPPADPIAQASVYERLRRRFGLGDRPETRQKFYKSLEKLVSVHGQKILNAISKAAAQAASARQPDRYFCSCVKVILAEQGISLDGNNVDSAW